MRKVFGFCLVLSLVLLAACASTGVGNVSSLPTLEPVPAEFAGKTNPLGEDAASLGQQTFIASCKSCHGPEGHGDGPAGAYINPKPKNLAELQQQAGDDYLFWRISTGRTGTAMIGWQGILSDEQIWQLIAFIRTLK